ncbi:MAG: metalloregulator ArsR/SmtB family transcription factor [Planctomycetales bacterium]|nr:metalloregulator ArsR/SmtB family transcription factor [Planctomycetales bacterium]NIM09594.1 metalloregulator ArsR/SmtB family transcription factor [Planctomycetales bacterium]NIN09083.1 metalloregulator ArsR/SmtB family transcription factor [Planctomycetales bacterium]NIN78193.1 metalloregulator ArsR/SmtB family transcription factor [Planctomycetales bacterium]NIO35379.1 metalloregulator ArsR/SmtB family transcription factor [Planctomycetales bacterium]
MTREASPTHDPQATCDSDEHAGPFKPPADLPACQRAADIFSALGDPNRLRLLTLLMHGEMCVTEIAQTLNDNLSAVSQRLKLLRNQRIVSYRREGKHVVYWLDDDHVLQLILNALAHAEE